MMHYAKQESITKRNKKRNISSRQTRTAWRPDKSISEREVKWQCQKSLNSSMYNVFDLLYVDKLFNKEKKKILTSLIFLIEKQDGKVKVRLCANGSVQR